MTESAQDAFDDKQDTGQETHRLAVEQNAQLRSLVDGIPDGLCLLDEKHRLLLCNDAGRRLLALLTPDRQVGETLDALAGIPVDALLDGETQECRLEGPPARQLALRLFPLPKDKGAGSWVLRMRDVTERRRLAELSRQQERMAAVGQLAAGIAHDFNNILSSILLYAQLLSDEPQLTQAGRRRLQVIDDQSKRAGELVRQILDFSRRSIMQRAEVEMVALCRKLVEGWRRTFPPNIDIHLHHRAERYIVSADVSRLQQALLNLALNAQEAMPRGGALSIGLSHLRIDRYDTVPQLGMDPGPWLHLTIADTGSGISPEALPHVFEPFFSTKPLHEGAGLGLAQVYGIVHQHGGHVKIDSEPQKGAIVSIYLPLQEDPEPLPTGPTTPPGVCSILVVEESAELRDALQDALSGLDHNLVLAASGKEALALVKQGALRPDLIIGDLAMPEMSGIALLQAVRVHSPRCRMIIISSYPTPADQTRLRAEGVIQWLSKPVSMSKLAERVQKVLGD